MRPREEKLLALEPRTHLLTEPGLELEPLDLIQRSAAVFGKRPEMVNSSGAASPVVSVTAIRQCCCGVMAATDDIQRIVAKFQENFIYKNRPGPGLAWGHSLPVANLNHSGGRTYNGWLAGCVEGQK